MFESVWPKHKREIKLVTTRIERLALLMRNEVRLEHIQAEHQARTQALEHFRNSELADRTQEYQSLKADISPKFYGDKLYWLRGRRCSGSGNWLLTDKSFVKWLDVSDKSTRNIWLEGIPGAGKLSIDLLS
jgi:hypothetical protein